MNRTALSVVALAVGAILILGLYDVYKPQTNSMVHDVFDKVEVPDMATDTNWSHPSKPANLVDGYSLTSVGPPSGIMPAYDDHPASYVKIHWAWHKHKERVQDWVTGRWVTSEGYWLPKVDDDAQVYEARHHIYLKHHPLFTAKGIPEYTKQDDYVSYICESSDHRVFQPRYHGLYPVRMGKPGMPVYIE